MKYKATDFYNEWIEFESEGKIFTADLFNVIDNGQKMYGEFLFNNQAYQVNKWMEFVPSQGTTLNIEIKEVVK